MDEDKAMKASRNHHKQEKMVNLDIRCGGVSLIIRFRFRDSTPYSGNEMEKKIQHALESLGPSTGVYRDI